MPLWLQVILAFVAPAWALGGVWLGGRLSAGSAEQQWRRDRLLQFCADLVAACHDVLILARSINDTLQEPGAEVLADPEYPHEKIQRMQRAVGAVRLLSEELSLPAADYADSIVAVVSASVKDPETFAVADSNAADKEGQFQRVAHDRLIGRLEGERKRPGRLWSRPGR